MHIFDCTNLIIHNGMASLKFIASQARSIHQNKNLKIKVLNCCADIFFNRQYLTKKIVPNYAKIKSIIYYTNLIIHKETVSLKKKRVRHLHRVMVCTVSHWHLNSGNCVGTRASLFGTSDVRGGNTHQSFPCPYHSTCSSYSFY